MTSWDLRADRRVGYARMLLAEGDLAAALSLLEQTAELAPDWPELLMLTGEVQAKLGQRDAAIYSFRRCLELSDQDRHGAMLHLALLGAAPVPAETHAPYVEALFDDFADRFDRSLMQKLDYQGPDIVARAIARGGAAGFARVLDLGCGTGLVGERIRRHCHWLEGVDLSAGMLEKARAKGIYDVLHHADITGVLAGSPGRFDCVVACDVLNYVGALEGVLAGIAGALTPGGRAVLVVEALEAGDGKEGGGEVLRLLPTLRYAHSADYVRGCAETAGFNVAARVTETLRQEASRPLACHVFTLERAAKVPAGPTASDDRIEPTRTPM